MSKTTDKVAKFDNVRVYLAGEKADAAEVAENREALAVCMALFDEKAASRALLAGAKWAADHKPGYDALVAERDRLRDKWVQLRELLATAQTV